MGEWDVTIKTSVGSLTVLYEFSESCGGTIGSASLKGETVPLRDLQVDGTIDGDTLSGHSRAGRLPRSAVTGVRRQGAIS
ncbi:hypothetical protein [Mycobacterium sp. URHB0021]